MRRGRRTFEQLVLDVLADHEMVIVDDLHLLTCVTGGCTGFYPRTGLLSETEGRVCVMLTAMDIGALPPALVRSGRIELWLDMRLPDEQARPDILQQHVAGLPPAFGDVQVSRLASATDGFTGADLKRLIEDGKALFAYASRS